MKRIYFIFIGLIFVLFKQTLQFWDDSFLFYLTNVIGYCLILFGLYQINKNNEASAQARAASILMLLHSIFFFILKGLGYSPLTSDLSSFFSKILAYVGSFLLVAGIFLMYIIILQIMEAISGEKKPGHLYYLINIMIIIFLISHVSISTGLLSNLEHVFMFILLIGHIYFLISFYIIYLSSKRQYG